MPTVMSLTCPVCGASIQPNTDRCDYCGSVIVIKTDLPRLDPRLLNNAVIQEHIAKYREALRRDRYDGAAHYGLGIAYYNLGLRVQAEEELTQASDLMPENPNIHLEVAKLYYNARDTWGLWYIYGRIRQYLDKALFLNPAMAEALDLKKTLALMRADELASPENWRGEYKPVGLWKEVCEIDPEAIRNPVVSWLRRYALYLLDDIRIGNNVQWPIGLNLIRGPRPARRWVEARQFEVYARLGKPDPLAEQYRYRVWSEGYARLSPARRAEVDALLDGKSVKVSDLLDAASQVLEKIKVDEAWAKQLSDM